MEERIIHLITTDGKIIVVTYEWDDADDDILLEIQKALKSSSIYCGSEWATLEIKFGEHCIMELDFKKIIGINW